jgi:hypothetical protein
MAIWNLFVRVSWDEKSLKDTTDKIKKKFKEAWDVAEKDMPEAVKKGTVKMESSFWSLWKVILGIFSITAITWFVKKLFSAGSDLEETQSKFNQVFKGQEDANARFEELGATLGRSALTMKDYGSTIGGVLKAMWFATKDALDLSQAITQLAIDTASFNNKTDDQVIIAFRGALTGEREALKSLGIAISETDVTNEYMRLGFKKTGDELSKQGKAIATYSLLLKATADAQWDAVRTGDSWANQLKRFRGAVLDAFAQAGRDLSNDSATTLASINRYIVAYGTAFLKVIVSTTTLIIDQLAVVWKSIGDFFSILSQDTQKGASEQLSFAGMVALTIRAIWTGIQGIVRLIQFFWQVIWATLAFIIKSTGDTATGFTLIWKAWVNAIVGLFKSLWPAISSAVWNAVFSATQKIIGFINNIKNAIPGVKDLINDLQNPFQESKVGIDTSGFKALWAEISSLKQTIWINLAELKTPFKDFSNDIEWIGNDFEKASVKIHKDFSLWVLESSAVTKKMYQIDLQALIDQYKNAQTAWANSGKWQKEASDIAKKAVENLKNETKKLEDSIKDLEKAQKDEDDATKKYHQDRIEELRKIGEELDKNLKKHQETIKTIEKERDAKLADNTQSEQQKLAERYAEIQKDIVDLQKETDPERANENQQKIVELKREQAIIQGSISQATIDEAVRVSNLTEAERIQLEAMKERKKIQDEAGTKKTDADAELLAEQDKLKKKQAIIDYFNTVDHFTRANLKKLEEDENFKKLDIERQNEILRQAEERIALEDKKNIRIGLEQQVNDEVQRLSNVSTEVQKTNLGSLSKEYKKIIADLDSAIQRQRTLNALRSSPGGGQWFAQGGYTGDGWVNDVAWVVHKWEYVVPQHVLARSPELLGSLEAMRQGKSVTNNTDKSMKFGDVIVQSPIDLQLFLEKQKFHLN